MESRTPIREQLEKRTLRLAWACLSDRAAAMQSWRMCVRSESIARLFVLSMVRVASDYMPVEELSSWRTVSRKHFE